MNPKWIVVPAAALGTVAALAACSSSSTSSSSSSAPASSPAAASPSEAASSGSSSGAAKTYTMAEVAKHNTPSDCWTAVEGNVYDVTDWINQHPGGAQRIIDLCGIDGTSAFEGQHEGQAEPEEELAQFEIGTLEGGATN